MFVPPVFFYTMDRNTTPPRPRGQRLFVSCALFDQYIHVPNDTCHCMRCVQMVMCNNTIFDLQVENNCGDSLYILVSNSDEI